MTTDHLIADAMQAKARENRYRRTETIIVFGIAIVVALALLIGVPALVRQNELRDLSQQNVCIAKVTADAIASFGDALAAPPAPNPERERAVDRIAATAKVMHNIEVLCPGP